MRNKSSPVYLYLVDLSWRTGTIPVQTVSSEDSSVTLSATAMHKCSIYSFMHEIIWFSVYFRLKKIQEKKKKVVKEKERIREKLKQQGEDVQTSSSILEEDHDEDLLF